MNRKRKKKKDEVPEYGSYKYAVRAGVKDPREFYRMRLEREMQKRDKKRICVVCGEKATYADKKLFKKTLYYCDKCIERRKEHGK